MTNQPLGRTGFHASLLGIGDLADRPVSREASVATLQSAAEHRLKVMDTAPGYKNGYSERILGTALKGRRDGLSVQSCDVGFSPALPPTSHE